MKGRILLCPDASCLSHYPESTLREWAEQALGAQRCSEKYLEALRIVLGNMSRADRHGAMLRLSTTEAFTTRQTMRTLLEQLTSAGLVERWGTTQQGCYRYRGKHPTGRRLTAEEHYNLMQQAAEDAAFERYCRAIGISKDDCPY